MNRDGRKLLKLSTVLLITAAIALYAFGAYAENIDPDSTGCKYAWAENVGWINFNPSQGPGVTVSDTAVTGMAWGENIGWISLSCLDAGTCGTVIYGVMNDGKGKLSGYAWGENVGWINFKPANGGVSIGSDGKFSGYAWGENIGWINFSSANSCVKTSWVPNRPPVAQDQEVTTAVNTAKGIVLTATDQEGAPLTFAIVTPPTHGTLTGTAPNVTYTPSANYHGPDSFTFKANDGTADSNIATVSIMVDVAPVVSVTADSIISVGALFIGSGSFSDPDPDTWTATVDYGDGSGIQPLTLKPDKTFTLSHIYSAIGMNTVTVVVTDSAGASGTWSSSVTVLAPVSITVQSNPVGRGVTVDGMDYAAPQTFSWTPGSSHTISTTSLQGGTSDTHYVFANWSDGGAMSHSITTPTIATTYTANFTTQYQLTIAAGPGGSVTPTRGNWYDAGTVVDLLAIPDAGYVFDSWSGAVERSGNAATTVTMNQPQSVTANFILTPGTITVQASPAGLSFTVDGVAYTSPQTFTWIPGSSHTIATTSPQSGAPGTRYIFTGWSDGGAMSHTITTPATTTIYTANFTTQYQLTTAAGTGGTVTPPSGNWYDAGTVVNLLATPDPGYVFSSWNGLVTSAAITVTMNQPLSMSAYFTLLRITVQTAQPGLSVTVDGTIYTSPQTFNWIPGSIHAIATTSPQGGNPGTRYLFTDWSDGGAMSHTIITPTTATNYIASFATQNQLTTTAGTGGSVTPPSGTWYDSGTIVDLQATPDPGYLFSFWSGGVTDSNSAATSIIMGRPESVGAYFNLAAGSVSVETSPPGLIVIVDGVTYNALRVFTWTPGSSHTLATTSQLSGTPGTSYVFDYWSDGGDMSHTITAPTMGTAYIASFTTCAKRPDGTPCDDGNKCTTNDVCTNGICAGTLLLNGTSCDDGNSCTIKDICTNGSCSGTAVVCPTGQTCNATTGICEGCTVNSDCHDINMCVTVACVSGACVDTPKANGTACDDGNACTVGDNCQNGICMAGAVVQCAPATACKEAETCIGGTCKPAANKSDGTPCDDGNACTLNDACSSGVCVSGAAKDCDDGDCCTTDSCDIATGACINARTPGCGTAGNPITGCSTLRIDMGNGAGAQCTSGSCFGREVAPGSVIWTDFGPGTDGGIVVGSDQACGQVAGTWNFFGSSGSFGTAPGGGAANLYDSASCTGLACVNKTTLKVWNVCLAGMTIPMGSTCGVTDYQINNTNGGSWSMRYSSTVPMGYPGNLGGVKFSMILRGTVIKDLCCGVTCTASDQCHVAGTCDPATGVCSNPTKSNGSACDDSDKCTTNDMCTNGVCAGTPVVCNDNNVCTGPDHCDSATGLCVYPPLTGTVCDDHNPCTENNVCTSGVCAGTPKPIDDSNACTTDACDPVTGNVTHTPVANGTPCDDKNPATINDVCTNGTCAGTTQDIFSGFFSPVDNPPSLNLANAGQTIPVKWRITDANGAPVSDPLSFKSLTSYLVNCNTYSGDSADAIEEYSTGSSGLQYLGDGNWQFNWITSKTYAGKCRMMVLTLGDKSTHTADFKFK